MNVFVAAGLRCTSMLLLAVLAACSDAPEPPAKPTTSVSTSFRFPNGVVFVVENGAATYGWRERQVREGPEQRVTDAELRLTLPDKRIVVTDAGLSGNTLTIDGVTHRGEAFRMRANGVIEPFEPKPREVPAPR
jgi:hypothetical protein